MKWKNVWFPLLTGCCDIISALWIENWHSTLVRCEIVYSKHRNRYTQTPLRSGASIWTTRSVLAIHFVSIDTIAWRFVSNVKCAFHNTELLWENKLSWPSINQIEFHWSESIVLKTSTHYNRQIFSIHVSSLSPALKFSKLKSCQDKKNSSHLLKWTIKALKSSTKSLIL